jgi:hypothetical protein
MAPKKRPANLAPTDLPADYAAFLESLRGRVRQAQTWAMLPTNILLGYANGPPLHH